MGSKMANLFGSRKFWALVTALVTVGGAFYSGQLSGQDAANSVVMALSAYSIATGIEDNGKGN